MTSPATIEETESIRVVIVDDQEVIREAFGMLISQEPTVDLVGALRDGEEAVHMVPVLAARPRNTGWRVFGGMMGPVQ